MECRGSILTVKYFMGILFFIFCFVLLWYPLANFVIIQDTPIIYDNTINHLLYMDDLKLFAKNDEQLRGVLNIVKEISNDIWM